MGALDNFLKRFGYAKLDRYGLVLTPDDRVISMRPAVLDDGIGSKIVGWQEGDLAAMELERWGAPKVAAAKPIAAPKSLHQLPPQTATAAKVIAPAAPAAKPAPAAPAPSSSSIAFATTQPVPAMRGLPGLPPVTASVAKPTPPAPVVAPVVAAAAEPGEDEWEWEIAMARARAAAEEVEQARMDLVGASAVIASAVIPRKTNPGFAAVAAPSRPSYPRPEPLPDFPKTEPFNEALYDKTESAPRVMSPLQKELAVAKTTKTPPRGSVAVPAQRSTVIPVPQLPTAADPRMVRPAAPAPRRLARGTGSPQTREETVKTHAVRPANDDKTSPYIELPSEVKPSGFAHTKRVAARQR